MKRIIAVILLLFYMGSSSGTTLYFHYCMGKLVQLNLSHAKKAECGFCGMSQKDSQKKSCCKDEHKQVQLDKAQKTLQLSYQFGQQPVVLHSSIAWEVQKIAVPFEMGKASLSNAPPERQQIPVFIRNCTYRV